MEPTDIRTRLRDGADTEATAAAARSVVPPVGSEVLAPYGFLTGRSEDTLRDLLAYGQYARAAQDGREPRRIEGEAATTDMIEHYRAQANAELHAFAFRYMHNQAEVIRQEAVREHLATLRLPPSMMKLVLANLVALGLGAIAWAAWHDAGAIAAGIHQAVTALRTLGR